MRNLMKMYELARASQIIPIPVTVPSVRVEVRGQGLKPRRGSSSIWSAGTC